MVDHLKLKGVTHAGQSLLSDQLEANIYAFMNWAFLGIGAFGEVTIPTSGAYGGDFHRLRPLDDPNFEPGQVWQSVRQDWVWETGILYDHQPFRVSGVNVDGEFYPVGTTGEYSFHLNYPLGQVLFDSAIPEDSVVTAEYCHRQYHFHTSDAPWWREFQFNSWRADSPSFIDSSGSWALLGQSRVQMPSVIIEASPQTSRRPIEIGNGAVAVKQIVLFHVFAENRWEKKFLHDVLTCQEEKRMIGFDKNELFFPLDEYGDVVPSSTCYSQWVLPPSQGGIGWQQIRVEKTSSIDQSNMSPLFHCTVRWECEVDIVP